MNAFGSNLFVNPTQLIQTQSIQNFNQPSISSVFWHQNEAKSQMENDNQEISKILTLILTNNKNQIYLISFVDESESLQLHNNDEQPNDINILKNNKS